MSIFRSRQSTARNPPVVLAEEALIFNLSSNNKETAWGCVKDVETWLKFAISTRCTITHIGGVPTTVGASFLVTKLQNGCSDQLLFTVTEINEAEKRMELDVVNKLRPMGELVNDDDRVVLKTPGGKRTVKGKYIVSVSPTSGRGTYSIEHRDESFVALAGVGRVKRGCFRCCCGPSKKEFSRLLEMTILKERFDDLQDLYTVYAPKEAMKLKPVQVETQVEVVTQTESPQQTTPPETIETPPPKSSEEAAPPKVEVATPKVEVTSSKVETETSKVETVPPKVVKNDSQKPASRPRTPASAVLNVLGQIIDQI